MRTHVSRRELFEFCAAAGVSCGLVRTMTAQNTLVPAGTALDHLLLGAADLDAGVAWVEKLTGVRGTVGGVHPGRGTRNALVSLGARQYLEIIAPDPAQPSENLSMNLRHLAQPRLIGWAAVASDIHSLANRIRDAGHQMIGPRDGSRKKPDGRLLKWRTLGLVTAGSEGEVDPIPFFIQWSADSVHPSEDSPKGCTLTSFEFGHPNPESLRSEFQALGIDAAILVSRSARLTAILRTPRGDVTLS
jgi:hypothetical protein